MTAAPAGFGVEPEELLYLAEESEAGLRLDRFLAGKTGDRLSRTRLQALIAAGSVDRNDMPLTDANAKVRRGDVIRVRIPPAVAAIPRGEAIALNIVFEDSHLLVIDKAAGLVVHPAPGHGAGTLVNALIAHCGASLSGIGGVRRPGIVHRLDKDTSGLLVVAKTDAAHRGLAALFADHGRTLPLDREYLAFVWGAPPRAAGTVDAPLGRHPHSRQKQAVVSATAGRQAITHWRREQTFGRVGADVSRLRVRLETGRTHQIRVHMAYAGYPLLGDPLYGTGFRTKAERIGEQAKSALEGLGRQALHAALLGFAHPVTGQTLRFESPLPADLARLETALRGANLA